MGTRDLKVAAWSLVAAPVVQLFVVVAMCPTLRLRVFSRPRLPRQERRMLFIVAGASMALGTSAALGENLARASVVLARGLGEIGAYQPAAVLSTQLFSILLSALATTVLVGVNRRGWHSHLGADISRTGQDLVLIVTGLALVVAAFRSVAIPVLFDGNMVDSGRLVVVSLAAEPMRCASWVAGAVLLPLGLQRVWLIVGLTVVITQMTVGLALAPHLGVWALSISYWASAFVSVVFTIVALSRNRVSIGVRLPVLAIVCSILVLTTALFPQPSLWRVSLPGIFATLPIAAAGVWVGLRHDGPLRSLLAHIQMPWPKKGSTNV
jgi:O-antigen/teichoic acid export membrane protein